MEHDQSTASRQTTRRRGGRRPGVCNRDGLRATMSDDRGSATAEYAVVILAAVAFAGVLVAVMRSGEVQTILTELVRSALTP
jgi:Flp pilus assembly pilin Flp